MNYAFLNKNVIALRRKSSFAFHPFLRQVVKRGCFLFTTNSAHSFNPPFQGKRCENGSLSLLKILHF